MKTLNEYIEESILDVDDLVADDELMIENWLKDNCKITGSYTIKNGVVDVKGGVGITNKKIKSIDVQFGVVTKYFNCESCESLTSLQGAPKKVKWHFNCSCCNSLTSLQGAPKEVGWNFFCTSCKSLTSLQGSPEKVRGSFYCLNCPKLTSLEGAPKCEKIISDLK